MNKYKKMLERVAKKLNINFSDIEFGTQVLADGTSIFFLEEEIALEIQIFTNEDMTEVLVDGVYTVDENFSFEIIDGIVGVINKEEVEAPTEEVVEELEEVVEEVVEEAPTEEIVDDEKSFNSVELADGSLIYFIEDELVEGISVFSDELMETPIVDGAYPIVDGNILNVVEGKITTIEVVEDLSTINENLKEELSKLKLTLKDVDKQLEEEIKKNESLEKGNIKLKEEIKNRPAVDSIKLTDEEIVVNEKVDIRANREMARHILRSIKK